MQEADIGGGGNVPARLYYSTMGQYVHVLLGNKQTQIQDIERLRGYQPSGDSEALVHAMSHHGNGSWSEDTP